MPALIFPNLKALRLVLASGLIPPEISRAPAIARLDEHGRLWLEPAEWPTRESLAALARVGVQALGGAGTLTEPVRCWAELLPLLPAIEIPNGLALFLVPDQLLAKFVAQLRQASPAEVGVRLMDDPPGFAWVTARQPNAGFLAALGESESPVEVFAEQAPGIWVRHGWCHPLPNQLVVPSGCVLLVRPPRSIVAVAANVPMPAAEEFPLLPAGLPVTAHAKHASQIRVLLSLVATPSPATESLWVLDAAGEAAFWNFCSEADEHLTRRLEAAAVAVGTKARLVVRSVGKRAIGFLPLPTQGFATDPRIPGLFVPSAKVLKPTLRVRELARALGTGAGRIVWVEAGPDGGVIPHAIPVSAFRPVLERIAYASPTAIALAVLPRLDPFPPAKFDVPHEPVQAPEPDPQSRSHVEEEEHEEIPPSNTEELGWISRSLRKLLTRLLPPREEPEPIDLAEAEQQSNPTPAERKIASPDALLHGHDWSARRKELEARLFHDLPHIGPFARAKRWSDLAAVYSATGNSSDAAVCWLNAVWESPEPPPDWQEQWLAAECRAAKLTDHPTSLERWLSEPGRPGFGRVAAAYIASVGFAADAPAEFVANFPRLLGFLDLHFHDLPVRAAWLARLAAGRVCDGDALGLARWRDRLLARLADRGPGLDLDEPSFLRFHGTASAERFQTAREWLKRVREPAVKWAGLQGNGGSLRWAGLDADTESTKAYAQFLFAWGLGCLGDRTLAKDWAAKARKAVARSVGPGVDPSAHAVLGDLFLQRVKDAQEGRPPKSGLSAELQVRIDNLSDLARFAVDRLREHSRVLEPLDRVRAFRGLELKIFWGNDRLGERLFVLADRTDRVQLAEEAEALLQVCATSPTTDTVPRVVLTLLEVAPRLEPAVVLRILDVLPTALDWMEAWLAAGPWTDHERMKKPTDYSARMIETAFSAAATLPPAIVGPAVAQLVRRLLIASSTIRRPLLAVCGAVFRTLRRLGLRGEAEELLRFLDSPTTALDSDVSAISTLGLAIGRFTTGDEDNGNRILDEVRDSLFLSADSERGGKAKTERAIAYAEALGFAPPRIGHGRLEEIFQRLGRVEVQGATNRYFALKPLQLIDAVVRSVVTDEFTLGPAVRGWLDDDEFLIRDRIHRDLAAVLREEGIG